MRGGRPEVYVEYPYRHHHGERDEDHGEEEIFSWKWKATDWGRGAVTLQSTLLGIPLSLSLCRQSSTKAAFEFDINWQPWMENGEEEEEKEEKEEEVENIFSASWKGEREWEIAAENMRKTALEWSHRDHSSPFKDVGCSIIDIIAAAADQGAQYTALDPSALPANGQHQLARRLLRKMGWKSSLFRNGQCIGKTVAKAIGRERRKEGNGEDRKRHERGVICRGTKVGRVVDGLIGSGSQSYYGLNIFLTYLFTYFFLYLEILFFIHWAR